MKSSRRSSCVDVEEEEDVDEDEEDEEDLDVEPDTELVERRRLSFLMARLILRKLEASCGCALNGSPDGGGGIVTSTSAGGM